MKPSTETPRRAPLEHVPVSDRYKVAPSLKGMSQQFIYDFSNLKGLRLCSRRTSCNKRICAWCSTHLASAARRELAPVARSAESVLVLRLALRTSTSLEDAFTAAVDVSKAFTSSRWLARRADGWLIQREVTLSANRWNVHTQVLVFASPERLETLANEAPSRWCEVAASKGHNAALTAQYAAIWSNPRKAVAYTAKGLMAQKRPEDRKPGDGLSPGDILAAFHAGDADAAERWDELENFISTGRRRWVERGGMLRGAAREAFDATA